MKETKTSSHVCSRLHISIIDIYPDNLSSKLTAFRMSVYLLLPVSLHRLPHHLSLWLPQQLYRELQGQLAHWEMQRTTPELRAIRGNTAYHKQYKMRSPMPEQESLA